MADEISQGSTSRVHPLKQNEADSLGAVPGMGQVKSTPSTKKDISTMTVSELNKLGGADLRKLNAAQLNKLNVSQLNKLDSGQLRKLSPANQAKLNPAQKIKIGLASQNEDKVNLSRPGLVRSRIKVEK